MSWLKDFGSAERRYRNYVRYDLQLRAPEALRTLELTVSPTVIDSAFRFAWDHHKDDWNTVATIRDFDHVAEESSVTILHFIANETGAGLQPAE
jgi:hypothetical protein